MLSGIDRRLDLNDLRQSLRPSTTRWVVLDRSILTIGCSLSATAWALVPAPPKRRGSSQSGLWPVLPVRTKTAGFPITRHSRRTDTGAFASVAYDPRACSETAAHSFLGQASGGHRRHSHRHRRAGRGRPGRGSSRGPQRTTSRWAPTASLLGRRTQPRVWAAPPGEE